MQFKLFLESSPQEPEPVPPGFVRLYHYVSNYRDEDETADSIKKHGLDINKAKGSTYNEPNLIWASTEVPKNKLYVAFDIAKNDPRWAMGKPQDETGWEHLISSGGNVALHGSVKPEEIKQIFIPWHRSYFFLKNRNLFPKVRAGDYDYILKRPNSDEAKAIRYIKQL